MIRYTEDGKVDRTGWCAVLNVSNEDVSQLVDALDAANERIAQLEAAPTPVTSEEVERVASELADLWLDAATLLRRLDRERQALETNRQAQYARALHENQRADVAEAALAEARKDAERLDAMLGPMKSIYLSTPYHGVKPATSREQIDAAIAAIAREGETR